MEFLVFSAPFLWLLQHKASVWDRVCLGTPSNGVFLCDALRDLSTCALRIESYWLTWKMLLLEESEQKQCSYCFSKMWWTFKVIMSMSYLDPNCDIPCISIIGNIEPLWKPWRYSILDMSFVSFDFPVTWLTYLCQVSVIVSYLTSIYSGSILRLSFDSCSVKQRVMMPIIIELRL